MTQQVSSRDVTEQGQRDRKHPRGPSLVMIGIVFGVALVATAVGVGVGPSVRSWFSTASDQQADGSETGTWYISQMHPWIIQPEPGQCPICGMDLTPVDPARFAGEIAIDPVVVQNMGVRVAPATLGAVQRTLRTVGTVAVDESTITDVVQRFDGWVEDVHVAAQWDRVEADEPLFSLYAPAVFTAEEEWLVAQAHGLEDRIQAAAYRKLELLGVSQKELERVQREQQATDQVMVYSPSPGYVWEKNVQRGSQIMAKTVAYRIVDLSQVWIEATIYEDQLPFVSVGQTVQVSLDKESDQRLTGQIDIIYPMVDMQTRASRVRIVVQNTLHNRDAEPLLKPGMFVTVEADVVLEDEAVRVPHDAVIGTGERKVVFISLGRGKFEPRDVVVSAIGSDGMVAIASGVEVGEQIVVSGQFLLDSESKMRSALAKVMQGDLASQQQTEASGDADQHVLPADVMPAWQAVVTNYLTVQQHLYQNGSESLSASIAALHTAIQSFVDAGKKADEHFHHVHPVVEQLLSDATDLHSSDGSLASVRPIFGALSITLDATMKRFGQPEGLSTPVVGMRCGMADGIPDKGVWIQIDGDVQNPYFGRANDMRSCAADVWGVAQAGMQADENQPQQETSESHGQHEVPSAVEQHAGDSPVHVTSETVSAIEALYAALYHNNLSDAQQAGHVLATRFADLGSGWQKQADLAHAIMAIEDLDSARMVAGDLGVVLRDYATQHPAVLAGLSPDIFVYRCGMARGIADKGVWLQLGGDEPRNPYFGHEHGMNACAVGSWSVQADGLVELEW